MTKALVYLGDLGDDVRLSKCFVNLEVIEELDQGNYRILTDMVGVKLTRLPLKQYTKPRKKSEYVDGYNACLKDITGEAE